MTGTPVARAESIGCRTIGVDVVDVDIIQCDANAGTRCPLTVA